MQGDYDLAVELYQQSLALHPTAEAHTFLGWTFHFQGKIDEAIAVKVSEERSPNIRRGKLTKFFWTIRAVALPPIKKIFCDQKNFGKSVLVEIVNDERINQVRVFRGRDFFVKNQFKRWIAFASLDRQVRGVDSFYRSEQFHFGGIS